MPYRKVTLVEIPGLKGASGLSYAVDYVILFEVLPVFAQFALHERLLKAVAELNFVEPTPVQAAAIPRRWKDVTCG